MQRSNKHLPKVAVIVLNYNDKNNLQECIDSLLQQTYSNFEILFIDNNSSDKSVKFIKDLYPKLRVIENKSNLGYAAGNNIGMEIAFSDDADLCLLLNTDTKTDKKMLQNLVESYLSAKKNDNKIGLFQPTILLYDEPDKINTQGNAIHYLGYGYCKDLNKTYVPKNTDKEIISVSGTAMLVSKDYYTDVGGLDESFFMYNEDQDLSWRGLLLGYKHYLSVKAIVYHKYKFKSSRKKFVLLEKNRLILLIKYYSLRTFVFIFPILALNELLLIGYFIIDKQFKIKIKSYILFINSMPTAFKNRKLIQKMRKISDSELINKFEKIMKTSALENRLVDVIVNPLYSTYANTINKLI